jgi:uncharacterized protein (TIGR02265 family)
MGNADGFHRPRVDDAIDLDEHLRRLPADATCKGLYFQDPIERARKIAGIDVALAAGLAPRRYVAFREYPYADFLRVLLTTAPIVHPKTPLGEGLRRLGRGAYDAFLGSHVGRVILGAFGTHFEAILLHGRRAYEVSVNFGQVTVEPVGTRHVRYHLANMPAFLETFQVGIVEGAMIACKVRGEVLVKVEDLANAVFDIQWA